jgi:Ser/Thr protein kinase RdoA (MazF antagonist)
MKDYDKLTRLGKLRRFHRLAHQALAQYNLQVGSLAFLANATNLLFRVGSTNGAAYVLRICAPGWRTDLDLNSEAAWLEALEHSSNISAPRPVRSKNGEYVVRLSVPGFAGEQRCTLMSWAPGVLLGKRLSEPNLFKMGRLFARLHAFSLGFVPPQGFTQRKMERVLARGEKDVLFTPDCLSSLPENLRELLLQIKDEVERTYQALYADPAGLRVIHHDLWHDNIKIYLGELIPLDFEDTVWGYPAQDIAMALQDLMLDVEPPRFEPLQAAFRAGYESHSPWPETYPGQIDALRAGRMLWVANHIAAYQQEHLVGYLERHHEMLVEFLKTGRLRRSA